MAKKLIPFQRSGLLISPLINFSEKHGMTGINNKLNFFIAFKKHLYLASK